ncbi:NhaP-type Na+/H+ or K+/H+ antiporter [Saccharothrix saharensis]|uniref:NhaP-type Na+/H+ or K+/H+ antiporter n=1 Tax=Saccharothrix saharensis TaxID=571190 RepID=A0A543JMU8_9PSEU|nr:NhaP-type Na+/H+ or K+/H+ antiporter [Saccharothrix saharensis]
MYAFFITALLGFGLYASTSGIVIAEFRRQLRTVVIAVTLGVVAKVALIFAVMFFAFREPGHLVLAVAVAQIDPLSVAAMRAKSRMSDSAKALLAAWASFDDPITVLLTVYLTSFALGGGAVGGVGSFAVNLVLNLALAGVAFMLWTLLRGRVERAEAGGRAVRYAVRAVMVVAVLGIGFVAVQHSLLLALALLGLFFRPDLGRWVDGLAQAGLVLALAAVGLVLAAEFSWVLAGVGAVLGVAAFGAQAVVAFALTVPKRWRGDRVRLALGQQNGLTAIILALLLEPTFPGAIAVVAPAVVVVNVLHAAANGAHDRVAARRPVPRPQPPEHIPRVPLNPAPAPRRASPYRVKPTP